MTNGTVTDCMVPPLFEMMAAAQNKAKLRWRNEANMPGDGRAPVVVPWPDSAMTPADSASAGSLGSPTANRSSLGSTSVTLRSCAAHVPLHRVRIVPQRPTVDDDGVAVDLSGQIRGEEQGGAGDVGRRVHAARWRR